MTTTSEYFDKYDPDFGDDRECDCGHTYERHFDSHEGMRHVGCKYCDCWCWKNHHGMPNYLVVLDVPVDVALSHLTNNQWSGLNKLLNEYHTGKPDTPPIGKASDAHLSAAYRIRHELRTTVKVAVRFDGHKEIVNE